MNSKQKESVTFHLEGVKLPTLEIDNFKAYPGEAWCIYGTGKSGVNEFLGLLAGEIPAETFKKMQLPDNSSTLSFEEQQRIFEDELEKDDTDFLDRIDPGTPARDFLPADKLSDPLITRFNMQNLLESGYRQLSSGQARKLLLLRALLGECPVLLLDCPYDGLDQKSCDELNTIFSTLPRENYCILVLVRNRADIPPWCSHLAVLRKGRLSLRGPIGTILKKLETVTNGDNSLLSADDSYQQTNLIIPEQLIHLRNGFVEYEGNRIFGGLNLIIRPGDHTLITGPNGCGKSSLLQLITGDNPKCYANELEIYGNRRGSGESIWDIKKQMGIVSADLHRNYRVPGSSLQVVLSGFFDTIGLYDKVSSLQKKEALRWLELIDLGPFANKPFRQLSYGDQRLVLIARALIKRPLLLILDEPTQGLDDPARTSLLAFLERISDGSASTILYVSHRQDEYRPFFTQHIRLEEYGARIAENNNPS